MLITCPTCASSYRIDAGKIGPEGRSVRCAACRETWFLTQDDGIDDTAEAMPDPENAAATDSVTDAAWAEAAATVRQSSEAPEEAAPEPEPRKRSSSAKKPATKKGAGKRRGGAASKFPLSASAILGLALLACVPVACLARTGVVALVPQTASVFASIGLPVNRRGIEIRDVVAFRDPAAEDRPSELVVEGDLVGVGRADAQVPPLTVEISDAAGKLLTSFSAPAPRAVLGSGKFARFRAKLADPPAEGRAIVVRFAAATPRR